MSELFSWYLAKMRVDSRLRGERHKLTPIALVARDKIRIQELIERSGKVRAERTSQIWDKLRKQNKNTLENLLNAKQLAEQQRSAMAIMLTALDDELSTEQITELNLKQAAEMLVRELEQAREGERLIADCTTDLLCCLDDKFLISEVNVEFELTSGYQRLSLLAVPVDTVLASSERSRFFEHLEACRQKPQQNMVECALRAADGTSVDLEWYVEWSPTARCYFCQARNITERKQRQRMQAEVTAMINHDLRLPVSGIGLLLENVSMGIYGQLSDDGLSRVDTARRTVDYMIYLIEQLLDAEKLSAGKMPVEPRTVALSDLYERCQTLVRNQQEQKTTSISFPLESQTEVHADFEQTVRVLSNLVLNAIKYSPAGASITVREEMNTPGFVTVFVQDNGPGIEPELQPFIFDRYKAGRGGTGLGLFIAKKLVELQGGNIGFTSKPGEGTAFHFTLPLSE